MIDKPPVNSLDYYDGNKRGYYTAIFILRNAGVFSNSPQGIFTLQELRKVYLNTPTEYDCAMHFVTEWEHWKAIKASKRMQPYFEELYEEKRTRDQAEAQALLWKSARSGNVAAQKAIYDMQSDTRAQKEKQSKVELEKIRLAEKEREFVEGVRKNLKVVDLGKANKTKNA